MIEIEIERKFHPTPDQLERLLEGAERIRERLLENTFYDSQEYALSLKDWWLRKRNGSFELKISLNPDGNRTEDRYREVMDESEIRRELNLPAEGDMEAVLADRGMEPFVTFTTNRCSYAKDGLTIDVDDVDFGTFQYHVVEIELIIADEAMAGEASERIASFARAHGLESEPVPGKVTVYLERERPEHFAALKNAGLVIESS